MRYFLYYTFIIANLISFALSSNAIEPVNQNASPEAKFVVLFINSVFREYVISGQHISVNHKGYSDVEYINKVTGKFPAYLEIDIGIYEHRNSEEYEKKAQRLIEIAEEQWKKGGLVGLSWHWGNPAYIENSYQNTKKEFDIGAALKNETKEHEWFMRDLDITAHYLQILQDKNIPILWRPLHEACGGWFWWSKKGRENLIALWRFMYRYYTNEKKLNNLVWVYSASNKLKADWFPGHNFVDILGVDIYDDEEMVNPNNFAKLNKIARRKPIALTENDVIPNPETLLENNMLWAWFNPWHSQWLRENSKEHLRSIYNHKLVITRDEMPTHKDESKIKLLDKVKMP